MVDRTLLVDNKWENELLKGHGDSRYNGFCISQRISVLIATLIGMNPCLEETEALVAHSEVSQKWTHVGWF